MKICDRCNAPATGKVTIDPDNEVFDTCETCKEMVREVLTGKKLEEQPADEKPSSAKRKAKNG